MSDYYGRHFCKEAIVEDNGDCYCKVYKRKTSCQGYLEDCEVEFELCKKKK